MDSTMEGMLDTYLLETESLLDKLDEMLIAAEKVGDFSTDDVNEIFRIMHTIKGSSAMMEFTPISSIAHHIEDMFFFIRDKGIDSLNGEQKRELFDLMFRSEDYLRSGLEKVKAGEELDNNVDAFAGEINGFLAKISGKGGDNSAAGAASTQTASASGERGLPNDPTAKKFIHVFLDEGIGMENLRAFMIVNAIKEFDLEFRYYPEDMDSNPETAQSIIDSIMMKLWTREKKYFVSRAIFFPTKSWKERRKKQRKKRQEMLRKVLQKHRGIRITEMHSRPLSRNLPHRLSRA